jgi:hypothetical protein
VASKLHANALLNEANLGAAILVFCEAEAQ